jgi:hypothetical protein
MEGRAGFWPRLLPMEVATYPKETVGCYNHMNRRDGSLRLR